MTDSVKTLIFAGGAVAAVALALFVSRPPAEESLPERVGKPLFADFSDPNEAAALKIVKVDESRGNIQRFQVERNAAGAWVIPSHGGYPADATQQMRDAATSLVNLDVIAVVSQLPGEQELYGVVEPSQEKIEAGGKGFGMVIDFKDKDGKDLAGLVIGKPVEGATDQRFVRVVGQDPIYVVKLDTSKLSTKFDDWIEKDLLKVSPWDIDRVAIKDYQFRPYQDENGSIQFSYDPRLDATVGWDADANAWTLDQMKQYVRGKAVATELKPDEELNKQKLDDLKTAVDNLQIVDVQPKPQGLGGDLSVDDAAFKNRELRNSLQSLGFLPGKLGNKLEFLGSSGEVNIGLKDGVEYVLRFGNTAGADGENGEKSKRYMFALARLDESRLKPPALEELPEAPADVPAAPADEEKKDDEKKEDEKPKETEFDLKRKRIKRENQRKLDDYNDRRKKAVAKVRELNARFAPWYYIISDDEFHKVHLTAADLVQERSGTNSEGFGPDAFRQLEQEGIDPPPPPMPMAPGQMQGLPPGLGLPGGQ